MNSVARVVGVFLALISMPQVPGDVGLAAGLSDPGPADARVSECRRSVGDYAAKDLGVHGFANAVNERGEVVGQYVTTVANHHELRAFLWKDGVVTDLGTGDASTAIAVNERGQVVGTRDASIFESKDARAFLWQDGVARDLGTLGGSRSFGVDLNDRGEVIGESSTASGAFHTFLWQSGTMTDLTAHGIPEYSFLHGINNRGQIVGQYQAASGEVRAFLWQRGTLTDMGAGSAVDINERGQVLISGPNGSRLWQHGESIDLGPGFSFEAAAMNDRGQIVGGGESYVALWEAGKITQIESDAVAYAINNRGQIAGASTLSGEFRGVVWSRSARRSIALEAPGNSAGGPTLVLASHPGVRPIEFELRNFASGTYVATVFDIGGRLVRRWERSGATIGRDSWDGTRRDGISVAPGVYFLQVESHGRQYNAKILLTR